MIKDLTYRRLYVLYLASVDNLAQPRVSREYLNWKIISIRLTCGHVFIFLIVGRCRKTLSTVGGTILCQVTFISLRKLAE